MLVALILSMRLAPMPSDHRPQFTIAVCPTGVHVASCENKERQAFFRKVLHLSKAPIA